MISVLYIEFHMDFCVKINSNQYFLKLFKISRSRIHEIQNVKVFLRDKVVQTNQENTSERFSDPESLANVILDFEFIREIKYVAS